MSDVKIEPIIIVRKRKAAHAAHHGGAWKVAYADFVTAMMSLFIVLWLTSADDAIKKSVVQYFNDPRGTAKLAGSNLSGSGRSVALDADDLAKLKDQLTQAERKMPDFDKLKDQIEITADQDGLRVEMRELKGGAALFPSGSADPTGDLRQFLALVAPSLGNMQNRISIEGHTDSVPYGDGKNYSNWELSADRANAARRLLQANGVNPAQIFQVRGFADQMPRPPQAPDDPSNRRITLVVTPVPLTAAEIAAQVKAADHKPEGPVAAKPE
jgi:chemotaxis protein MotB